MHQRLALLAASALAACATSGSAVVTPIASIGASAEVTAETLLAINALCSAEATRPAGFTPDIKLAGGMGTGGFTVDSDVKEAQDWFNYGLALSHAFYHQDAKAAMRRAVEADPACARCAWGEAWVLGPTLNYGVDDDQRKLALAAALRARALAREDDPLVRLLADAAVARYQEGETAAAFGTAMASIANAWPAEPELSVLAAHAMLIPVRDDDLSGLKPALVMLERVLKQRPDDTGAIHYYIHGTEFDGRAEDAIPYADRLGALAPMASHLVHMPAHTFFRAGRYHDAAIVNARAIEADTAWMVAGGDGRPPMVAGFKVPMYYAHNLGFGLAGALMAGDAALSVRYAEHAAQVYPEGEDVTFADPVPRSYVAFALHAPETMMALPVSTRTNPKYRIYRAYGRAEVFLRRGEAAAARVEMDALRRIDSDAVEKAIALGVLQGRLAMAEGDAPRAARLFAAAAEAQKTTEDNMDPPDWWYPVRRSVAAAWLKAGEFARAEAEASASLKVWRHDPLALWVLGKAQAGQGRVAEGEASLAEARRLWRGDFTSITPDAI